MAPGTKTSFVDDLARWLGENAGRFPAPLLPTSVRAGYKREYRFRGVPSLRLWAASRIGHGPTGPREEITLEVAVFNRRTCVDLLVDFDAVIERTAAANFFCNWCRDTGKAWYTSDRLALLRSHCFEPFLAWCCENIRENRLLVIEREGGFTAAHVLAERELRARWSRLLPGFVVTPLFRP